VRNNCEVPKVLTLRLVNLLCRQVLFCNGLDGGHRGRSGGNPAVDADSHKNTQQQREEEVGRDRVMENSQQTIEYTGLLESATEMKLTLQAAHALTVVVLS